MANKSTSEEKLDLISWVLQANSSALAHVKKSIDEYEKNTSASTTIAGYRSRGQAVDWAQLESIVAESIAEIKQGKGRTLEIIEHESDTW
jgi:hypothetical protein